MSKVKGQGHQAALLTAVLSRQAAAAVGVRTCWPWETAVTLPSARRRKALRRPRGEERGGSIPWRPPAYGLFTKKRMKTAAISVEFTVVLIFYRISSVSHVCCFGEKDLYIVIVLFNYVGCSFICALSCSNYKVLLRITIPLLPL